MCFTLMVLGIGFVFALMRLKSGSVWTGMILQATHNFSDAISNAELILKKD